MQESGPSYSLDAPMRRRLALPVLTVSSLAFPLLVMGAPAALAGTGTFSDPVDSTATVTDVVQYTLSYDGQVVSSTVTFADFDLAVAQSARLVVELDTNGDGAGDFELEKPSGGEAATVRRSDAIDSVCAADATFNTAAKSITLSAQATCIGSPSFVRNKVYFSADEGFDFAPSPDRYNAPVAARDGDVMPTPAPRAITCPAGGGSFTDPIDDPATSDIVNYRLSYDGSTVCVVFGLRAWDRASVQAGRLVAYLDVNGDGGSDILLEKPSEGETAKVANASAIEARCTADASFDGGAKTVTLSAPASCIDTPAAVRTSLYLSFDEGFDFAPGVDRFTSSVGPGTAPSPGPSATASPTPSTTPTATPTSSPSMSPTAEEVAPTLTLSPDTISAGQATIVTYRGTPGSTVDILSRTQPSTVFTRIGAVTLDSNGVGTSSHKPQKNTRITARTAAGKLSSTAPIIAVRSVASFNAQRVGTRTFTFTGRVYPALNNRLVNIYRNGTLLAQGRCDATGIYKITKIMGGGTFTFQARTPNDQDNLGTSSRELRLLVN